LAKSVVTMRAMMVGPFMKREKSRPRIREGGGRFDPCRTPPPPTSRSLPDPNRLKRSVHLVLRDLLPTLHPLHELIDLVALSRKGGVVLVVSFARTGVDIVNAIVPAARIVESFFIVLNLLFNNST
jgi:hypothetical protein